MALANGFTKVYKSLGISFQASKKRYLNLILKKDPS